MVVTRRYRARRICGNQEPWGHVTPFHKDILVTQLTEAEDTRAWCPTGLI